jgi:hypothetical protein
MQEVHITCPAALVPAWVNILPQQLVAPHSDIALIDFGCSIKQKRGYVVLCWASRADQAVIAELEAEPEIEDVSIISIPESGSVFRGKGV